MLKQILVGITPSAHSRAAAELAIAWAAREGIALLGLGVLDTGRLAPAEAVPLGAGAFKVERDEEVLRAARSELESLLAGFQQRIAAAEVSGRTLFLEGSAAQVLLREAERCDLIVLGKKLVPHDDHTAASETLHDVLASASRPVVCVPDRAASGSGVLVAYDGSLPAARALFAFQSLGLFADETIELLAVERRKGDLAGAAERAGEYLTTHSRRVQLQLLSAADSPADVLCAEIARLRPALVVMGAYGRSWLAEFFLGSVTASMLCRTTVPLFLFH